MYSDAHDILRLDDDGAPPTQEQPAKRIGILNSSGNVVAPTPAPVAEKPAEPAKLVPWPTYCDWRQTKCRPYDLLNGPKLATTIPEPITLSAEQMDRAIPVQFERRRSLEEIDQATHELVGECAELAELVMENGPLSFVGDVREKLIDECGDILFCGCWALDAWGHNALRNAPCDDVELIIPDADNPGKLIGEGLRDGRQLNPTTGLQFMEFVLKATTIIQLNVGLTANAFKKLRFQRRQQDVNLQCERILEAFINTNLLLITAGSTIAEAMAFNQRKLNARYPDGYVQGMGGGIRTGDGA